MVVDQLPDFTKCTEVAALGCGGKVIFASDDFFAAAEGMLRDTEPTFIADKFTEYGKWMDGWETRRKRTVGHDWCIIRLTGPTSIKGFLIDTAHFTGNYVPKISIQAALLPANADSVAPSRKPDVIGRAPSNRDFDKIARLKSNEWKTIVEMTELKPGYDDTRYTFISNTEYMDKYTHLRLNLYPDGGIARFRVYGDIDLEVAPEMLNVVLDMFGMQNGGRCLSYSNAHFGHPKNLNKPGRGVNMGDGWETARRLDRPAIIEMTEKDVLNVPGCEWAIFRLGTMSTITSIDVDTNHFKGNAPEYVTIEGTSRGGDFSTTFNDSDWTVIVDKVKVLPHKLHCIKKELKNTGPFNCVRITIAPDGGISRVRIFGQAYVDKQNGDASKPADATESETVENDGTNVETPNRNETPEKNAIDKVESQDTATPDTNQQQENSTSD